MTKTELDYFYSHLYKDIAVPEPQELVDEDWRFSGNFD